MLRAALDAVFPPRCAGCGAGDWPFCPACVAGLVLLEPPWCCRCGRPTATPAVTCDACPPDPIAVVRAPFLFAGPVRRAVHRLKFSGWRTVAEALAEAMVRAGVPGADVVTWVPLARKRLAQRGYDQARALAVPVAQRMSLPAARLLRRADAGQSPRGHANRR
jgi:predicted amidophosphoribosyltransferase